MRRSCTILAAAGLTVALASGTAAASTDTTKPVLNLPAFASFVVGTSIGDSPAYDTDPELDGSTYGIHQRVSWTGSDASGICGYDVALEYAGGPPQRVVRNTMTTTFSYNSTDYDDQQGGGTFKITGWAVTAHDCAGNTTTKRTTVLPSVTQEDGATFSNGGGASISYTGRWKTSNCACWSFDKDRNTTAAGAKVTINRAYAYANEHVALVMEKAPGRGKAKILVDGVLRATIDTNATTAMHRVVVWDGLMKSGRHSVQVINSATPGRPRIDLDAFLVNQW